MTAKVGLTITKDSILNYTQHRKVICSELALKKEIIINMM